MPNVITRGKMIVEFAGELISTLSEFNKKVSFSSPQSKEKMWAEILKLMVQKFTELSKTFPKYNKNIVNSLCSFLIDKIVFLLIKFENDRKKCADTEVKTDLL